MQTNSLLLVPKKKSHKIELDSGVHLGRKIWLHTSLSHIIILASFSSQKSIDKWYLSSCGGFYINKYLAYNSFLLWFSRAWEAQNCISPGNHNLWFLWLAIVEKELGQEKYHKWVVSGWGNRPPTDIYTFIVENFLSKCICDVWALFSIIKNFNSISQRAP